MSCLGMLVSMTLDSRVVEGNEQFFRSFRMIGKGMREKEQGENIRFCMTSLIAPVLSK